MRPAHVVAWRDAPHLAVVLAEVRARLLERGQRGDTPAERDAELEARQDFPSLFRDEYYDPPRDRPRRRQPGW